MWATDSCYERVAIEGRVLPEGFDPEERYQRSTYKEIIRRGIRFNNFCDVHSENPEIYVDTLLPELLQDEPSSQSPAQPVPGGIAAVYPKAPTIIGEDPYASEQPELKAIPVGSVSTQNVRRAKPAAVLRIGSGTSAVKLRAPEPIEFPELD